MSAWIVDRAHIDVLVQALTTEAGMAQGTADEIGRTLWRENLRSVAHRYPGDEDGQRPGPLDFKDSDVDTYIYREPSVTIPEAGVVHAVQCYVYQSCEHQGWEGSLSAKWMQTLVLRHDGITGDGPWGFEEEEVHAVTA